MSHAPRPVTAASSQTPPAATPTQATAAPRGIANTPSTITPAAESPSCLSQIGSMISSLVSSIFSWFSSLWNCVTRETDQTGAPVWTPATPAQPEVLVAQARSFLNERVFINIPEEYPRKVGMIVTIDGHKVAAYTMNLQEGSGPNATTRGFCDEAMRGLETLIRQYPSLTTRSTVNLCVMDLKRRTDPELNLPETIGSYNMFNGTLSATNAIGSYGHGSANGVFVHAVVGHLDRGLFSNLSQSETRLRNEVVNFFGNQPNARSGWTYRD